MESSERMTTYMWEKSKWWTKCVSFVKNAQLASDSISYWERMVHKVLKLNTNDAGQILLRIIM